MVCIYQSFPSCCFVPESTRQPDRPNSRQISTVTAEDQGLVKSEYLIQYQAPYPQHLSVDPKKGQPVTQRQGVHEIRDNEVAFQQQVPFLKLLSECEETLGTGNLLNISTQDTFLPQDRQPEMKPAFREYGLIDINIQFDIV